MADKQLRAAQIEDLAASKITSGTFADARIAASNVTQHQAALSVTESQISDLGSYKVTGANETANVDAASTTAAGKVELATGAETVTGTDTARAVTPDGLTDRFAAPGAIGGTTPATRIDYDRSVPTRTVATGVTTSYDIDWSAGREWDITMSGNTTFTFSNAIAGESINVTLRRSAAATFTLPAMEYMDNVNGTTAPAQLDATTSILRGVIYYDGTEYIASFAGNYAVYS